MLTKEEKDSLIYHVYNIKLLGTGFSPFIVTLFGIFIGILVFHKYTIPDYVTDILIKIIIYTVVIELIIRFVTFFILIKTPDFEAIEKIWRKHQLTHSTVYNIVLLYEKNSFFNKEFIFAYLWCLFIGGYISYFPQIGIGIYYMTYPIIIVYLYILVTRITYNKLIKGETI